MSLAFPVSFGSFAVLSKLANFGGPEQCLIHPNLLQVFMSEAVLAYASPIPNDLRR